ncbi:MAG: Uncharacterised protein [Flavobacteriaceae bacterium]|nr:MAG: Uncharacterised protein [Flavobacteriaceae bacterium]
MSFSTWAGSTFLIDISKANFSSIAFFAAMASSSLTPIQIECSDDACVIMITLIFAADRASNKRLEKPVIPIMPLPSKLIKATLSI